MTSASEPRLEAKLCLRVLDVRLAVCRLGSEDDVPSWAASGEFVSITRTAHELSVVCSEEGVPSGVRAETGWRVLEVEGPLDFDVIGVLNSLAGPLARANISIFVLSTFDTDYVLVREGSLEEALEVLTTSGHTIS